MTEEIEEEWFDEEKTEEIESLMIQYNEIEEEILDKLSELPRGQGDGCICNDRDGCFISVHEGSHFDEIHKYCTKCGGFIDDGGSW